MAAHSSSLPLNLRFSFPRLCCSTVDALVAARQSRHESNRTRRHIGTFALASYEPNIERVTALLLHLDKYCVSTTASRVDGYNATSGHDRVAS